MKIVKWEADFCKACKEYDAVFMKAVEDWNVRYEKVDVTEQEQRAVDNNISLLPTTSVFNDAGKEVYRLQGKRELTELVDVIKEFKDV